MKRLLMVAVFILFLSINALAGHSVAGNGWCECNSPESHNNVLRANNETDENQAHSDQDMLELGTFLVILFWLKLRA